MSRGLAVAVGGAAGAALRWAVLEATGSTEFPWAVLAINIVGCFLLGLLVQRRAIVKAGVGVGFCGGLTTFSTFTVELAQFLDDGRGTLFVTYLLTSVVLGLGAALAGTRLAR